MSHIYFPGCKYTTHAPKISKYLSQYMHERFDMTVTGCCSVNYKKLTQQDTAVYVCPTCNAILQESAPQTKSVSVWEILIKDDKFKWPDYHGKKITIQDCWRTYDNKDMQYAIRAILKRMNFETLEISASYDKADFCGTSLLKPQSPRYEYLAPVRFIEKAGDKFNPHTESEQIKMMKNYCQQYKTNTVVCYCTGCLEGLQIGGVNGVHLMDLVMG